MTEFMNHEAAYRTAPATSSLLKIEENKYPKHVTIGGGGTMGNRIKIYGVSCTIAAPSLILDLYRLLNRMEVIVRPTP